MEWLLCCLVGGAGGVAWVLQGQITRKRKPRGSKDVQKQGSSRNPDGSGSAGSGGGTGRRQRFAGALIEIVGASLCGAFLAPAFFEYPEETGKLLAAAFVFGCAWPKIVRGFRRNTTEIVRDILKKLFTGSR